MLNLADPFVLSDTTAVLSCLAMACRFLWLIRGVSKQLMSVRKAMIRVGVWIMVIFIALGLFIAIDTANLLFHMKLNAGQIRDYGVAVTVLIVGQGLARNLALIFAYIERPTPVPVPRVARVEYPPIPPMPTLPTGSGTDEFAKYANTPAPPMPTKNPEKKGPSIP